MRSSNYRYRGFHIGEVRIQRPFDRIYRWKPGTSILALVIFVITCVLTGIPAALVIWLSEKFRLRSILFFECAGAVTGALGQGVLMGTFTRWPSSSVWLFVVAGFVAGMAYWWIAGRHAGRGREVSGNSA
jgi:hypothetical protein